MVIPAPPNQHPKTTATGTNHAYYAYYSAEYTLQCTTTSTRYKHRQTQATPRSCRQNNQAPSTTTSEQQTRTARHSEHHHRSKLNSFNYRTTTPRLSINFTSGSISSDPVNPGFASVFSKNGCRGRFIMSEVGAADRSRLLRSKRSELRYINSDSRIARKRVKSCVDACHLHFANWCSGIVTSRKRKLREFFAVCDTEGPLPQLSGLALDAPPATPAEERFLVVSDILKYVASVSISRSSFYKMVGGGARCAVLLTPGALQRSPF